MAVLRGTLPGSWIVIVAGLIAGWVGIIALAGCGQTHAAECAPPETDGARRLPDGSIAGDGGSADGGCLSFHAYFEEGYRQDLAEAVDPDLVQGGSVHVPGALQANQGFGMDNVFLQAAVLVGHPWADDAPQTAPSQLGLTVGGSADAAAAPAHWPTEGFEAAKAIFDAMTRADETTSGDARVRTTPAGLTRCTWTPPGAERSERAECLLATMRGAAIGIQPCPALP